MPTNYLLLILVLLIISVGGIFFFMKSSSVSPAACVDAHLKILAFGDSLVAGYGATSGHDFPTLLAQKLGVPVQNFGRSGDTTSDALNRIDTVTQTQPDIVIVLLGGNDALQRTPLESTKQNLAKIIETLQSAHARVILVGVQGGFTSDPYEPMFKELARTYHVTLVSNILNGIFGHRDLMSDEVHPNDAGYAKIAATLAPVLMDVCAQK